MIQRLLTLLMALVLAARTEAVRWLVVAHGVALWSGA